ncbi:hypothetical protein [Aliivibrio salmonicida]|uniref:hypothetical protein n=1 Tax=Aliivibrio salmonicida TaxID=40269 RepID=UPI003D0F41B5
MTHSVAIKNEIIQSEKHLLASTNMKKEHYKMQYRLLRFTRQVILFEMKTEQKTMAESAPLLKDVCEKLHPSCSFSSGCDIYGMGNRWLINRLMNVNKLDGMTALLIAGEFSVLPKSQLDDRFSGAQKKDSNFMWYQELSGKNH